jgi:Tol biopolymer transport system component/predicted Ser/Thr protein kinase
MGEVYRARDSKLGRNVAIKVLRRDIVDEPDRKRRFVQEARTASALNHPNIVTIHDIDQEDGRDFIVMEYLDGRSLDQAIPDRGLDVARALEYAVCIASAIQAAHAAGVVHRDIKPANIIVSATGHLKVVDFGLAKLVEPAPSSCVTHAGAVLGTPAYMSPEQAQGLPVDGRSDIFAFGTVLYEMLAGQRPFGGSSPLAMRGTISGHTPPALKSLRSDVPAALERVITECLQENPTARPTAANIVQRLTALRGRGPVVALPLVAAVVASVMALTVAVYLAVSGDSRSTTPQISSPLATPLTAYPGFEQAPTLSPDGSQVAFSWNGPGQDNFDIYFKLVGPGEPWRLTTDPAHDDKPAWSPDGAQIAFLRFRSERSDTADLIVIPALGGAERKIATVHPVYSWDRPFSNLSWTPDGRWLAFGGALSPGGPRGIWLIAADGHERRKLTVANGDDDMGDLSPIPSPDGRRIAFIRERTFSRGAVFVLPLTAGGVPDGSAAQLTPDSWSVNGVAWAPDGQDLLFSWGGHFGLSRLSRISATLKRGGVVQPTSLPFGEQASALAISKSGRVVYSAQFRDTALYEASLAGNSYQPLAGSGFSSTFDEGTAHYSPDGTRVAFASTRSGVEEIWVANRDGSNVLQVTSMGGPQCSNPRWSPDGRTILFNSRREGSADLYTLVPETRELRQLTSDPSDEIEPRWSGDGQWIYFGSNKSGRYEVWRISAEGGDLKQITRHGGTTATESPDGRYLYYAKDCSSPTSIWRMPVEGGAEERVADGLSYSLNFVVAGRGLYFLAVEDAPEKTSIDFFEFATGTRTRIVDLRKKFWFGMALSPDGKSLLFSLVNGAGSNLMLVENFR